ncbi:hypothetical protein RhiJN_28439 [Ceratobasidium sp. AG-Ba]|nr:hypothetical protein RhiJN_28439 [Ceratobasidium sp. AG-Ba]
MSFAEVDRISVTAPSSSTDLTERHPSPEHVASGIFSPAQDADLLREAALRSRRARKQVSVAASSTTPRVITQQANGVASLPSPEQDVQMEDVAMKTEVEEGPASHHANLDTEDGEILEDGQNKAIAIELDPSREMVPQSAVLDIDNPTNTSYSNSPSSASTSQPPVAPSISNKTVRPFLNMNATDLEEAKRLILDLLGMGVTPEYLVDCGISSQCLAVCLYEMNLRFPINLDQSQVNLPGIYDLDVHMRESVKLAKSTRHRAAQKENSLPVAPMPDSSASRGLLFPNTDRSTNINGPRRGSLPSPPASLPSRPVIIPSDLEELPYDTESIVAQRPANASDRLPPTGPRAQRAGSAVAEEQKRMELLARKAAMDSIAKKRAAKSSPNPEPDDSGQSNTVGNEDVGSAVDALLAAVSMGSALGNLEQSETGSVDDALPEYDSDAMVEDELDAHSTSISDVDEAALDPGPVLGSKQHLSSAPLSTASSPHILPVAQDPDTLIETLDEGAGSGTSTPPIAVTVPIAARKSRPTASDFIDQAPPRPSSAFTVDAPLKRKRCFVDPQVWPRRLVIDLDSSDEEDEEDDDEGTRGATPIPSTSNDRGSLERSTSNGGGVRPSTKQGHDMAAQMLLEKELQIKAMMQKIKMRELKKKMGSTTGSASGSTSGTPVLAAASIIPTSEGISAIPPLSATTTPPPEASVAALEATKQETAMGVVSTLKIQQETVPTTKKSPSAEVLTDNAMGSSLGAAASKVDKGKGKVIEPQGSQGASSDGRHTLTLIDCVDFVTGVSASTADSGPLDRQTDLVDRDLNLTHFKTYKSPLAGFTSPNLQPAAPTDRQLPTIYWISSTVGQDHNVDRKLCQYEFPSGVCKDQTCKDIHARQLGASDDDIRRTVAPMFPNAGPGGLASIVRRVRQSTQPEI